MTPSKSTSQAGTIFGEIKFMKIFGDGTMAIIISKPPENDGYDPTLHNLFARKNMVSILKSYAKIGQAVHFNWEIETFEENGCRFSERYVTHFSPLDPNTNLAFFSWQLPSSEISNEGT